MCEGSGRRGADRHETGRGYGRAMATPAEPCPLCEKHRGVGELVGPVLWGDEQVVVSHRPLSRETGSVVAGYLFVETRDHVARWQDLDARQAAAVARASWTACRILADRFDSEHVFTAIVGLGVAHVHQHVFVRHPGTPATVPWHDPESWDDAPLLDARGLDHLADALRARFDALM